jgi:hypothetical protein
LIRNGECRPMIWYCRTFFHDKPVVGVEVGVDGGTHALSILQTLNVTKLYLVDDYKPYVEYGNRRDFSAGKQKAIKLLSKQPVEFIYEPSPTAALRTPKNLDFVYIDANHEYASVQLDLWAWYPRLAKRAVLGGHDFTDEYPGVRKAVMEFADDLDVLPRLDELDWWITKQA